jgi:mxaK protein
VALSLSWGVSRRSQRRLLIALALLAAVAAFDALQWWRLERWNAQIAELGRAAQAAAAAATAAAPPASAGALALPWDEGSAAARPALRFAQAHALATRGQIDAAINQYGRVPSDTAVGRAARFNSANLLLRQAIAVSDKGQPGQALPLIELAKETLREVLRNDPEHWPARYNLERAQRLAPDPDDAADEPAQPANQAERAATTMRGYSPGLP